MHQTIKAFAKHTIRRNWPALFMLLGGPLYASENWSLQPSLQQSGTYDSNPLMESGKHKSLYGSVTTPGLNFTGATPTTNVNAFASFSENIYNQSDFNSTDFHSGITLDRSLERWGASFSGKADYDTTRTSELTTLNNTAIGSVRHFGKAADASLYFKPGALDKITLSGGASQSIYEGSLFKDYHILTVTPSYEYTVTPVHALSLSLPTQRYQTENDPKSRTDSYAPTLGWKAHLTSTLTASASIGSRHYSNNGPGITPDKWKWKSVYSAGLDYQTESDKLNLTAKRDLQPYANGSQSFLNSILLSDTHAITPLISANAGLQYQYSAIDKSSTVALKSLKGGNAGLTYHATETVDISATYSYREQTLTNVHGSQKDNQAMLTIAYRPEFSPLSGK